MIAPPPPPSTLMTPAEQRAWMFSLWRLAVPALVSLALVLLMLAPLPLAVPAMPALGLMGVVAWALLQPALMPPWLAFLVGMAADLLFGVPLGVNAVLFALAAGSARAYGRAFRDHVLWMDWLLVAAVVLAACILTGPLMALAGRPVPLAPQLWQWPTSVLSWPLVARGCAALQRALARTAPLWLGG